MKTLREKYLKDIEKLHDRKQTTTTTKNNKQKDKIF